MKYANDKIWIKSSVNGDSDLTSMCLDAFAVSGYRIQQEAVERLAQNIHCTIHRCHSAHSMLAFSRFCNPLCHIYLTAVKKATGSQQSARGRTICCLLGSHSLQHVNESNKGKAHSNRTILNTLSAHFRRCDSGHGRQLLGMLHSLGCPPVLR